jgi:hypothetical protein
MTAQVHAAAETRWEASCALQFLPGCRNVLNGRVCGHCHPLACKPPMPADRCPGCGAPVTAPDPPVIEPAVATVPYSAVMGAIPATQGAPETRPETRPPPTDGAFAGDPGLFASPKQPEDRLRPCKENDAQREPQGSLAAPHAQRGRNPAVDKSCDPKVVQRRGGQLDALVVHEGITGIPDHKQQEKEAGRDDRTKDGQC